MSGLDDEEDDEDSEDDGESPRGDDEHRQRVDEQRG